jgi:hypothetical protein
MDDTEGRRLILYGKRPNGNGWIEIGEARHPDNRARGVLMYNVNSQRYWLAAAGSVIGVPQGWARERAAELAVEAQREAAQG